MKEDDTMDAQVEQILTKTAGYIEVTQPIIDQQNENRAQFVKRATQVAGVLASRGLIARDKANAFVDKVAADESGTEVWDLVEKLAEFISADELGEASEKTAAAGQKLDPFERWAVYGSPHAEGRTPGMIE
jgi:hypothetical protein